MGLLKIWCQPFYLIVKDRDTLDNLLAAFEGKNIYALPTYYYAFDVDAEPRGYSTKSGDILLSAIFESDTFTPGTGGSISSSAEAASSYYQLYGGLLFIGIF